MGKPTIKTWWMESILLELLEIDVSTPFSLILKLSSPNRLSHLSRINEVLSVKGGAK
jgi:hypothetical protein